MSAEAAGRLPNTARLAFVATGSIATAFGGVLPAAAAAPVGQPANVDPGRWADAFNGWSVGFGASYDYFRSSANVDSFGGTAQSPKLNGNDPFAAIEIGRDFRSNNYVLGIYGDIFAGEKSAGFQSSNAKSPSGTMKLQAGGALTARAGFMPTQQSLLYGLGGWTWQHYEASLVSGPDYDGTPFDISKSGFLNGPTVGVGYEMLFPHHPNVSFKTEYRYTHFDAPGALTPDGSNYATFGNVDDHSLRFILSFKMP